MLQGLPPGSYSPLETVHPSIPSALVPINSAPQWTYIVIVCYEDSPIGPCDEFVAVLG